MNRWEEREPVLLKQAPFSNSARMVVLCFFFSFDFALEEQAEEEGGELKPVWSEESRRTVIAQAPPHYPEVREEDSRSEKSVDAFEWTTSSIK